MKLFTVNTHHAYLNHMIRLTNLSGDEALKVKDRFSEIEYVVEKQPLEVRLTAGEHILYAELNNNIQQESIHIEDAIKLGGGKIKKGFVFDNNPWCFIVLNDRTYIYNLVDQSTAIEYNLSPESITKINGDYFIFKTGEDYSLFNADIHCSILDFQTLVYYNDHVIAYKRDDKLVVYNYQELSEILTTPDRFYGIHEDILYFYDNDKFRKLNLLTDEEEELNEYRKNSHGEYGFCIYKFVAFDFIRVLYGGKYKYNIINLTNGNSYAIELPVPIKEVDGNNLFSDDNKTDFQYKTEIPFNIQIRKDSIDIGNVYTENDKLYCEFKYKSSQYYSGSWWNTTAKRSRVMDITLSDAIEYSFVKDSNADSLNKVQENNAEFIQAKGSGRLLGKSESGAVYITQNADSHLFVYFGNQPKGIRILKELDTSGYLSAYFSSDGKTIIFKKTDKSIGSLGLDNLEEDTFEIEGFTMPDKMGVNGYQPNWDGEKDGKPVWRDPITLQPVKDLSSKIYKSFDGRYIARNNFVHEHFNLLTNKVITDDELHDLAKRMNYNISNASKEEKAKKIEERKKYVEEIGEKTFFELYESKYPGIRSNIIRQRPTASEERINHLVAIKCSELLERDIAHEQYFVKLFVPEKDYLVYKDTNTKIEHKVYLGYDVWFLNYVSFSYDSRYLAFAAKFIEGSGVFGLYDVQNEKEIIRYEKTPLDSYELRAVWMALFSKKGDVAFYDSRANAYIIKTNVPTEMKKASGKSLLTFSPSGKYIALSDQNYICGMGHQPSGNVFIHETEDFETPIERYNDIGTQFKGIMQGNSVASVAFSADEKRLLMVGADGVVVIRNLYLTNNIDSNKTDSISFFFMKNNLPQNVKITKVEDENGIPKELEVGQHSYDMFIPLSIPINGYDKVIVSKSAKDYLQKTPDADINKLRIGCVPMPVAFYPPQSKEYQDMFDEIDSSNWTLWGCRFSSYYGITTEQEPPYTALNFNGFLSFKQ